MHAFGAGRGGQRTIIRVVVQIFRQQILRVNQQITYFSLLPARNPIPYGGQGSRFISQVHQHRENHQMARFISMHEMGLHRIRASVQLMFAGFVEMKLLERIGAPEDFKRLA